MIDRTRVNKNSIKHGNRSERGDFLIINKPTKLYLKDGKSFDGMSPNWQNQAYFGEVVFNTGMTGYVESLTDPSYANQILVFTYPMIGNYGVQLKDIESSKIQVAGIVINQLAIKGSHANSDMDLIEWLSSQNIPVISAVDTRALTKHLRSKGTMIGAIAELPIDLKNYVLPHNPSHTDKPTHYNKTKSKTVILVDCGAKDNILQSLIKMPFHIIKVPENYDYTLDEYDAVVYSNGPGDPTDYQPTIEIAQKALQNNKPVFGICLGNQIIALAAGAKTFKLPFGHRGHNQPCMELESRRCFITSQNHGYAIEEKSLPKDWQVSFRNLNDNSIEGIKHRTKPYFAVQFHPEASPGPTDTRWLFDKFEALI